jgi:hypothetical protein
MEISEASDEVVQPSFESVEDEMHGTVEATENSLKE